MRHNVHILLGSDLKPYVARLGKYVIKYGEASTSNYYKCYTWEKDESGAIEIKKAESDANAKAGFVSTTRGLYATKLVNDSNLAAENPQLQLQHFFTSLHQKTVTINNQGDSNSLLLALYLPLYDSALCQQVIDIISSIDHIQSHYSVMVVGLCSDLHYLLCEDAHNNITPEEESKLFKAEKENIHTLSELQIAQNSLEQFVILQNNNAAGFALNLDEDSLIRIIGELSLLCVEKFNTIFSQTAAFDKKHPITSLGLSVLNLDKYYFANYLLRKSYLHILDREDVSADSVDVNKVAVIANQHLLEHQQLYTNFYEKEIKPLVGMGTPHNDIMSQVGEKLDAEMSRVSTHLLDYISDPSLTLPEKKALLAMILGYDDPLLHGNLFNQDQLTLDNLDEDATKVFIDANNSLVTSLELKDGRKTYSGGVLKDCVGDDGKVELPIKRLQQLRNSMRESTNYIRQKYQELADIEQMTDDSVESEHLLTENGFVIDGKIHRFDVEHKEVKFEETYQPSSVVDTNVDLREDFTPIKDQGTIGACTVFSVASIFEYILKKNSNTTHDLSEAFVYYNVRHDEGKENEDTGSSFQDVIKSIGTSGICTEELHPYSSDISEKPSELAFEDAKKRRITKALNVNVQEQDIKSAIQEGYPVAISLKIFDSFKSTEGFVTYPTDKELSSGEFGYHAMVICGYSDESRLFVVRNSWGESFGDDGYCYIPYSYICDSELNRMACIITEVDTTSGDVKTIVGGRKKSGRIVQFNMNDNRIKTFVIKNLLNEEERNLQKMQKEDNDLRTSYEKLMQSLGRQSIRKEILEKTQEDIKNKIETAKNRQRVINTSERPEALRSFDKNSWKIRIALLLGILVSVLIWGISCYIYVDDEDTNVFENFYEWLQSGWCITMSLIILILGVLTGLYWWNLITKRRRLEMDLEEQSEMQAVRAKKMSDELKVSQLRFHIAGMVIDGLLSLKTSLDKKYQSMKSYIGNLSIWQSEEQKAVDAMEPLIKDPFIPLLNNETLEQYFANHKEEVTGEMHLYEYFNGYKLDDEAIMIYKLQLKDNILNNIHNLLSDFTIFRHIFNVENYPYLDREYASAANLLPQLDNKSVPFAQIKSSAHIMSQARFLFINTDAEEKQAWKCEYPKHFELTPISEDIESIYKIIELRLQPLAEDELLTRD